MWWGRDGKWFRGEAYPDQGGVSVPPCFSVCYADGGGVMQELTHLVSFLRPLGWLPSPLPASSSLTLPAFSPSDSTSPVSRPPSDLSLSFPLSPSSTPSPRAAPHSTPVSLSPLSPVSSGSLHSPLLLGSQGTPPGEGVVFDSFLLSPSPPATVPPLPPLLPPPGGGLDALLPTWAVDGSAIPEGFCASVSSVTEVLVEIHQRARVLRRLPPLHLWSWKQKRVWERSTRQMVPYLEAALRLPGGSEGFLRMCLRLQEMPYLVLASTLSESRPLSEGRSSLSSRLRRVESLTLQDRLREAGKVLCSNGVAGGSEGGFERIGALHPALKEGVPLLHTDVPQFLVSPAQARRALFGRCGEAWVSLDPFGWSTALLHLVRAAGPVGGEGGASFFGLFSGLVARVVCADVSSLVAFALSAGSVFALNKDPPEVRAERELKGLAPRERPINQGSLVLQLAFDLALSSKPARKALSELQPVQQGVGAPRGMELVSHTCSSFYDQGGYAILKADATNGFQEVKRASLHQAVLRRCPSLQRYYTTESVCFYSVGGAVRLVRSQEGARIGCRLSSFAFALTVHSAYRCRVF